MTLKTVAKSLALINPDTWDEIRLYLHGEFTGATRENINNLVTDYTKNDEVTIINLVQASFDEKVICIYTD